MAVHGPFATNPAAQDDVGLVLRFFPGNLEPRFGAMEGIEGSIDIDIGITTGEPLLGPLLRLAGAPNIDIGRALGRFGQDGDFIWQNFRESPSDSKALLTGIFAVSDLAD